LADKAGLDANTLMAPLNRALRRAVSSVKLELMTTLST
jgi:hypothetical protein